MFVIAVTGGVASGKSLFVEAFVKLAGERAECFDCDRSVHSLLAKAEVLAEIKKYFGSDVFDGDGELNRRFMRERVFASENDRKYLEALLHPLVREHAQLVLEAAGARKDLDYLLFEVPLLYEVDFSLQRDTDVVVAASPKVQVERLRESRGLNDSVIEQIMESQLPMDGKISRAQQVIWNDACEGDLIEQAHLLKGWIDKKVGE